MLFCFPGVGQGGQSLSNQAVAEAPSPLLMQELLPELSFHLRLALSTVSPTQDYDSCRWAAERIVPPTQPYICSGHRRPGDSGDSLRSSSAQKTSFNTWKTPASKTGPVLKQHKSFLKQFAKTCLHLVFMLVHNTVLASQLS